MLSFHNVLAGGQRDFHISMKNKLRLIYMKFSLQGDKRAILKKAYCGYVCKKKIILLWLLDLSLKQVPYLGMKCPFSRLLFSFVSVQYCTVLLRKTKLVPRWFALLISSVFCSNFYRG